MCHLTELTRSFLGKTNVVSNNNGASTGSNGGITPSNNSIQSKPNGIALGGLFAGGMPKLKVTGRLGTFLPPGFWLNCT